MNKQHWKIHFGSFEKFELISGGINNFLGGNFKFHQTSPTPLSSGKNKNCWIISTNLSVSVQQRASAAATMWSKVALLSFFLTVHVYYNSPDMWSYCFWVITHVATTTTAVWGGGKSIGQNIFHYREIPEREIPVDGQTKRVANLRVVTSGGRWGGSRSSTRWYKHEGNFDGDLHIRHMTKIG